MIEEDFFQRKVYEEFLMMILIGLYILTGKCLWYDLSLSLE